MDDDESKKGMLDVQCLYPDVIYRFNYLLQTVWRNHNMGYATGSSKEKKEKDVFLVPVFFSKGSRTFHWIGLDSPMWNWEDKLCQGSLETLIGDLKVWGSEEELDNKRFEYLMLGTLHPLEVRRNAWEQFLADQPGMEEVYKEAVKKVRQTVELPNNDSSLWEWEKIHRSILILYAGFHHDAKKRIEGVFYRFLELCSNHGAEERSDCLEGELVGKAPFKELKLEVPCKELNSKCGDSCLKSKCAKSENISATYDVISLMFLEHLLLHKSKKYENSLGKKLDGSPYIALLPLYDLWIRDRGYGGIKAVLIVCFEKVGSRETWLKEKYPKLRSAFQELAEEVKESAETLAASLPVTPPYDLVRHFLKVLICVQDWESAAVFEGGTFQFEYKRKLQEGSEFKWDWELKKATDSPADQEPPKLEPSPSRDAPILEDDLSKKYMWWTAGENGTIKLWSKEFIPGLSVEEANRFGNFSIRFEFPKATHIPSGSEDRKLLYQEYLRQQLDLMRMLIPKVRARRSALRNAAVSIMARNMSHNIGSHVLAAVRGDNDAEMGQVKRLNEHLQRRMDFIAELATVEVLSAADSLLFDEVLGVEKEIGSKAKVDGGRPCGLNAQQLLLKHISGIQVPVEENGQPRTTKAVEAVIFVEDGEKTAVDETSDSADSAVLQDTQKEDKHERVMVSFNSGVLGWQALYVILENIIRNVAKHGDGSDANGAINIFLKVLNNHNSKKKYYDEFFEVCIWDNRGKAGCEVRDDPNTKVVEYLAKSLKQPRFLDDDNSVTKKDWGMKEMYISAAFLRGVALSDLEGLLPQPPLIEVCAMNDDGEVNEVIDKQTGTTSCVCNEEYKNLGFRLYLPKAKSVAIIVDDVAEWRKSFGAVNGNNEDTEKVGEIENSLKKMGVNFFSVENACGKGTRIPHRYGVWLSKEVIPEERRAELPPDFLEDRDMEATFKQFLGHGKVESLIQHVRNQVLTKRLERVVPKNASQIWTCNGEITQGAQFGGNLKNLDLINFKSAVVFDWHGDGVETNLNNWLLTITNRDNPLEPNEVVDQFAFYESHRGPFPQTGLFPPLLLRFKEDGFKQEALCAALTPVLILDERFQRIADQPASSDGDYKPAIVPSWNDRIADFKMGKVWKRMRVHVPDAVECDVEQPNLEEIVKYIGLISKELGCGAYVVVHQTIFEKLPGAQGKELEKYLASMAQKFSWVSIVCSGRGVPWQLQGENTVAAYRPRFIALSALLQCLEHMPSKLHLIRLLEVTRAPSKS